MKRLNEIRRDRKRSREIERVELSVLLASWWCASWLTYLFLRGIYVHLRAVAIFGWTTEATSATWASPAMSAMPPMPPLWLPALYSPQVFWIIFSHSVSFAILLLISDFNATRKTCDICWYLQKIRLQMCPRLAPSCWICWIGQRWLCCRRYKEVCYGDLHIVDGTCQCEAFSRRAVSES